MTLSYGVLVLLGHWGWGHMPCGACDGFGPIVSGELIIIIIKFKISD